MTRTVKWFATNSKCYYGLFTCDEHGLIKGRFRVKQTEEGRYYAVRIMKHTDEKGALKIYEKQINVAHSMMKNVILKLEETL